MKDVFEKIIEGLKEKSFVDYEEYYKDGGECLISISDAIEIFNQVAEEYKDSEILNLVQMNADFQNAKLEELKNLSEKLTSSDKHVPEINVGEIEEFCEWEYDAFEKSWRTQCGVLFKLNESDCEITLFCPYCGKKIKGVE